RREGSACCFAWPRGVRPAPKATSRLGWSCAGEGMDWSRGRAGFHADGKLWLPWVRSDPQFVPIGMSARVGVGASISFAGDELSRGMEMGTDRWGRTSHPLEGVAET